MRQPSLPTLIPTAQAVDLSISGCLLGDASRFCLLQARSVIASQRPSAGPVWSVYGSHVWGMWSERPFSIQSVRWLLWSPPFIQIPA